MSGSGGILYYTVQSNLWVLLISAVYLALSVAGQVTGTPVHWRALEIARFAVLVGITITFLVCSGFCSRPKSARTTCYRSTTCWYIPLCRCCFIADFFLFDRIAPVGRLDVLWVTAMPMYYSAFSLIHAAVNPNLSFEGGGRYPYFFMDVDTYGWFGFKNGPGVFWWAMLILGLSLGLGYLYRFLMTNPIISFASGARAVSVSAAIPAVSTSRNTGSNAAPTPPTIHPNSGGISVVPTYALAIWMPISACELSRPKFTGRFVQQRGVHRARTQAPSSTIAVNCSGVLTESNSSTAPLRIPRYAKPHHAPVAQPVGYQPAGKAPRQ